MTNDHKMWKIESGLDHFWWNYILSCLLCECAAAAAASSLGTVPMKETKLRNEKSLEFTEAKVWPCEENTSILYFIEIEYISIQVLGHVLDGLTYNEEAITRCLAVFLFSLEHEKNHIKIQPKKERKNRKNWLMMIVRAKVLWLVYFIIIAEKPTPIRRKKYLYSWKIK